MIQDLINQKLLAEQEERTKRQRSGKISPSSFGYCFRKQHWNRKNEPITNPVDVRTLRIFKAASLFHDFVQGLITEHQSEDKVETEDILGFADLITEDSVIDIKSEHSRSFFWRKKSGYDINKEKLPNILQLMTYAKLLNKPKGVLCIISKDDMCIDEYVFFLDKWQDKVEEELKTLRYYWSKNELPPPQPRCYGEKDGKPNECEKYCSFRDKCYELEKATKLILKKAGQV